MFAIAFALSVHAILAQSTGLEMWLTKGDRSALLEKQKIIAVSTGNPSELPKIRIETGERFQSVDGFG